MLCLVSQSCLTLCKTIDCSPPGSSVHGDSPGKNTGVGCHALLQGIFPTQGLNLGLWHCRQIFFLNYFYWSIVALQCRVSFYSTATTPKDTHIPVFIAHLFIIARKWKQPKCPPTGGWIKKTWYICTVKYYSAIKRNEIGSFVET